MPGPHTLYRELRLRQRASASPEEREIARTHVLGFRLLQDGDVGVGVFPEGEKVVVGGARLDLGGDRDESAVLLLQGAPSSLPADIDGYLGMNDLHAERIELDFASNTLRWQ